MKLLLIWNPKAGKGRSEIIARKFKVKLAQAGIDFEEVAEHALDECLTHSEMKLQSGFFPAVVAIGGDGLVHNLLPILTRHHVALHIIPAGSGNDCARALNMYRISDAKRIQDIRAGLQEGKSRTVDLGEIDDGVSTQLFLQIASTGFDAHVNEHANSHPQYPSGLKYLLSTLLLIWKVKPINYSFRVASDSERSSSVAAMLLLVANGPNYGGGMKIAPHASTTDGQLEVMYVLPVSPLELLLVFPLVYFGLHVRHPKVRFLSTFSIELGGTGAIYADGEHCGNMPALIRISEQKLTILAS